MKFIVALCLLFALIHAKPVSDENENTSASNYDEELQDSKEVEKSTQKILTKVKASPTSPPTTELTSEDDFSDEESEPTTQQESTTTEEPSTTPKNSAASISTHQLMTAVSILLVIFTIKF